MSTKQAISQNYHDLPQSYHQSTSRNGAMQLESNFEIEEDANNGGVQIEEQQDEEEAAIHGMQHQEFDHNGNQNYFHQVNHLSKQFLQNKFDRFSASCNLSGQNNNFGNESSHQNIDSNNNNNNVFEKDQQQEQQLNIDTSLNQPFMTFTERPRADSQRLPNLSVNCEKKQYLTLQQKVSSLNNSDSTLFRADLEKQGKLAATAGSESLLLNSSNEQLSQYQGIQNINEKALLLSSNQNASNSMDEDTSSLSTSVPLKKHKKSICKNNSPQSSSLNNNNNSHYNSSKLVNRKKSNTVNTSIFSATSQKKERNANIIQQQNDIFNASQGEYIEQEKFDSNNINNNNSDSNSIVDENNNSTINNNNLQREKSKTQEKSKQSSNNPQSEQTSKKIRFTPEEDDALMSLIQIHGKKWKVISELMDGKNETRIRNRYYSYIRKILKPGENNPSTGATPTNQHEIGFDQINVHQSISEQNNPESFQENQGNSHLNQTNINSNNGQGAASNNNHHINQKKELQSTTLQGEQSQFNQNNHHSESNLKHQQQQQDFQQLQQSTLNIHPPPFFNSTLFDSLNVLTLNNFEKDFNGICYETNNNINHFQSNIHDSLLVHSNHQLLQFPFSSNNLNFDNLNHRIPSFKFLNGFEGSLANLDNNPIHNIGKQYFQNFKNSVQEFEAIDAEDFNQKFYRNGSENNNPSVNPNNTFYNSDAIIQEEEQMATEYNQNSSLQQLTKSSTNEIMQNFNPNRILKPFSDVAFDEPSPLIFAKVQQKYDPKRFLNVNVQQQFNAQTPVSKFSVDEEMAEENTNEGAIPFSQNEESGYKNMSDNEKIQKIKFLNSQVENIQTLIEQCKQEILKEFLTKNNTMTKRDA